MSRSGGRQRMFQKAVGLAMSCPRGATPEEILLDSEEDQAGREAAEQATQLPMTLTPLGDLDLMIQNGRGDVPQMKLPADWRTRVKGR